jgi:hypothetical protein
VNPVAAVKNGVGGFKTLTWLQIIIVVFQTILVGFVYDIRVSVRSQDVRLRKVEQFVAASDRWSKSDQLAHEQVMATQIIKIWQAISELQGESK